MPHKQLNARQQRFVDAYLTDFNPTRAAFLAGYSEASAQTQGARLLVRPHVAAAISQKLDQRNQDASLSADQVLTQLVEEANADLADLFDENGRLKPMTDWPPVWHRGLIRGIDVEDISRDGVTTSVIRKIRLSDRVKHLEMIGKHVDVAAFEKRVKVNPCEGLAEKLEQAWRNAEARGR